MNLLTSKKWFNIVLQRKRSTKPSTKQAISLVHQSFRVEKFMFSNIFSVKLSLDGASVTNVAGILIFVLERALAYIFFGKYLPEMISTCPKTLTYCRGTGQY